MSEPFVHEALFYRDDAEYLAGTVPFIEDGLAVDEPVLVAVPAANVELLRTVVNGRVRFLDMTQAGRNPGRIIPGVLHSFVSEHGPRRVRVIGEPIWAGRSAVEYPACVQHEALINAAFAGREATILCPYDAAALHPHVLVDAARTHPVLVAGSARQHSEDYTEPGAVVAAFNRPLPEPSAPAESMTVYRQSMAGLRRFVGERAAAAGLAPARTADLLVAVNELATNSIMHAGGSGTLRVWSDAEYLVCEMRDAGRFDRLLAGRIPPPLDAEHGRGLVLVNHLCDLVTTYSGPDRTVVRLHIRR
jgi:anti-sigma regulatory factor (Ser/Thr protein kinase)